jgi:hypothetical protein
LTADQLPIRYRDFHDFPRMIVTEYQGELFLLDSRFDAERDEYEDDFLVYALAESAAEMIEHDSWERLASVGKLIGKVPTKTVSFDPTRRASISALVFEQLEPAS